MNNYCTNCGKNIEKDELICKNCNVPIIDLPYNYEYKSPEEKATNKQILKVIGVSILLIIVLNFGKIFLDRIKINIMKEKYVEPFLKENYYNMNYSIKYNSSGKCIVSGNCSHDFFRGCDLLTCDEYVYLDENECKSYYYSVTIDTKDFIVTVVNKNNQFYAVEGRNIYGKDKEEEEEKTSDDPEIIEQNYDNSNYDE